MNRAADPLLELRRRKASGAAAMKPAIDKEGSSPHLDEGSSVRPRTASARPSTPSSPDLGVPPRDVRVDNKIREAEILLANSPANDSRRRLLQAATLRRDEGLVDAILSTLREAAPPSRR
jgi:hypothetical protein